MTMSREGVPYPKSPLKIEGLDVELGWQGGTYKLLKDKVERRDLKGGH